MLCCIIPMAIAAATSLITGVSISLFSGPMLYATIAFMALSTSYFLYEAYSYFSNYFYNTPSTGCGCESEGKAKNSCHSKMTDAMKETPSRRPTLNEDSGKSAKESNAPENQASSLPTKAMLQRKTNSNRGLLPNNEKMPAANTLLTTGM